MYAAAYGQANDVRTLLSKGADPNLQNDDGATALMYAADDLDKTRALLDGKAKPDIRSGEGRTALMIAASGRSSYEVAKLLLDRGADAKIRSGRQSSLQLAALAGDLPLIRLLLNHGADPKGLFLGSLRAAICRDCMDLLLPVANPDDLSIVTIGAALAGNGHLLDALLDRGAKPHPVALHLIAISPEPVPKDVITRLIGAGADPKNTMSGHRHPPQARIGRRHKAVESPHEPIAGGRPASVCRKCIAPCVSSCPRPVGMRENIGLWL